MKTCQFVRRDDLTMLIPHVMESLLVKVKIN